jgi:hypothetical protein
VKTGPSGTVVRDELLSEQLERAHSTASCGRGRRKEEDEGESGRICGEVERAERGEEEPRGAEEGRGAWVVSGMDMLERHEMMRCVLLCSASTVDREGAEGQEKEC